MPAVNGDIRRVQEEYTIAKSVDTVVILDIAVWIHQQSLAD